MPFECVTELVVAEAQRDGRSALVEAVAPQRIFEELALIGSDRASKIVGRGGRRGRRRNEVQRRSQLLDSQTTTRQLLALANTVEKPRVLARATVAKTTARSKRNSSVVGAFLGLLLGIAAALLWDRFPGTAVVRRPGL